MLFRSNCLRAAAVTLVFVNTLHAQTTRSVTESLFWRSDETCLGFGIPYGTVEFPVLAPFGDPLPTGARLRSASFAWPLGNGHLFSWQGIPVVAFALNGTPLGGEQTIINYDACAPPSYANTYTFASGDYPDGFPGYQYGPNAVNQITMILTDFGAGVYPVGPATLTLTYDEDTYTATGQILDGSPIETNAGVTPNQAIYAQVPLGLELRLGIQKNGVYLPAKFDLTPATLTGLAAPTLYPTNAVLEYSRNVHEGQKTFRAVHIGTQTLTVTPDDTSIQPFTFTLGVFDPGTLGDANNEFDPAIVDWGNKRGIPPHILKGQIQQESGGSGALFDPKEYRYEPLNPSTGDKYVSVIGNVLGKL